MWSAECDIQKNEGEIRSVNFNISELSVDIKPDISIQCYLLKYIVLDTACIKDRYSSIEIAHVHVASRIKRLRYRLNISSTQISKPYSLLRM